MEATGEPSPSPSPSLSPRSPACSDGPSRPARGKEDSRPKAKEWQRNLDSQLRQASVDWAKIRTSMELSHQQGHPLDPNYVDITTGISTIHSAAYEGHTDIVEWCLATKADPNLRTAVGRTPLHYACDGNRTGAVRALLNAAADPNQGSLSGMTALHFCCQNGSYDALLVLLHESSEVVSTSAEDTKRRVPEDLAKEKRILRLIKKYEADLEEKRKIDIVEDTTEGKKDGEQESKTLEGKADRSKEEETLD